MARIGTADGFLITRNIINSELGRPLIKRGKQGTMSLQKEPDTFVTLGPKKGTIV